MVSRHLSMFKSKFELLLWNAMRFAFSSFSFLNSRIIVVLRIVLVSHSLYLTSNTEWLYIYKISVLCCFQCALFVCDLFSPANLFILTCSFELVNIFFKVFQTFFAAAAALSEPLAASFIILPPTEVFVNKFFNFFRHIFQFSDLSPLAQRTFI